MADVNWDNSDPTIKPHALVVTTDDEGKKTSSVPLLPIIGGAVVLVGIIVGVVIGTSGAPSPSHSKLPAAAAPAGHAAASGASTATIDPTQAALSFPSTAQYASASLAASSPVQPEPLSLASLTSTQKSQFAAAGFESGSYQPFRNPSLTPSPSSSAGSPTPAVSGTIGGELQLFLFDTSPTSLLAPFPTSVSAFSRVALPSGSTPTGAHCIGLQGGGTATVATYLLCAQDNALFLTQTSFIGSDRMHAMDDASALAKVFFYHPTTPGTTSPVAGGSSTPSGRLSVTCPSSVTQGQSIRITITTGTPGESVKVTWTLPDGSTVVHTAIPTNPTAQYDSIGTNQPGRWLASVSAQAQTTGCAINVP